MRRVESLSLVAPQLCHEPRKRRARISLEGQHPIDKLHHVDATLPPLNFGYVGLRPLQPLSKFDLCHARLPARSSQGRNNESVSVAEER